MSRRETRNASLEYFDAAERKPGRGSGNRDAISIDGNLLPRLLGKLIASRFHARKDGVHRTLSTFPGRWVQARPDDLRLARKHDPSPSSKAV